MGGGSDGVHIWEGGVMVSIYGRGRVMVPIYGGLVPIYGGE